MYSVHVHLQKLCGALCVATERKKKRKSRSGKREGEAVRSNGEGSGGIIITGIETCKCTF